MNQTSVDTTASTNGTDSDSYLVLVVCLLVFLFFIFFTIVGACYCIYYRDDKDGHRDPAEEAYIESAIADFLCGRLDGDTVASAGAIQEDLQSNIESSCGDDDLATEEAPTAK